jgi:hypothetical protein
MGDRYLADWSIVFGWQLAIGIVSVRGDDSID